jgi:hypothetical protein
MPRWRNLVDAPLSKGDCCGFESRSGHHRSLTQLDRVPVFETGSWEFESLRAGQILVDNYVI